MMNAGNTIDEGRAFALKLSLDNPGLYVTLFTCFGLFARTDKRLHVCAPTDSYGTSYWLNGKEKTFTENQIIADQLATPTMS